MVEGTRRKWDEEREEICTTHSGISRILKNHRLGEARAEMTCKPEQTVGETGNTREAQ
jgi:hypothetical protein